MPGVRPSARAPSPGSALTKGINFVNVRAFAETRHAVNGGWNAVVAGLPDADQRVLEGVVAIGWYPLALYARLIRVVDQVHGTGDLQRVVALGKFEAERDLTTLHRIFLRLANPIYLLEKSAEYWRRFHDTGRWVIVQPSPREAIGHLDEWGCIDEGLCTELVGYLGRAFELTGARRVRMEHPLCRARQDARCTFKARWD
jgi:hypothetical protein